MAICSVVGLHSGVFSNIFSSFEMDIETPSNLSFKEQKSLAEILSNKTNICIGWLSGIKVISNSNVYTYPLQYYSTYLSDIIPGYGVNSIVMGQNGKTYINISGIDLTSSGFITNTNFVQSGFIKKDEVASSGFMTKTELVQSGLMRHSELLQSGYLKHQDLLSSGYVRNIKGLTNVVNIVGSGSTAVWVDGQTIQIGSEGGPGGGITSVNSQSGPAISVSPGSGIHSIINNSNNIIINASGGPYIRHTNADRTFNTTTLQDIVGLEYPIGPNEVICGEAVLFVSVATAATGVGLGFNGPASPVFVRYVAEIPLTTGTFFSGTATAFNTKIQAATGVATVLMARISFHVVNGTNAGTLVPRMCSEGTTVVTAHRGSYAVYHRV